VDVHYPDDGGARAALVVADDIRLSRVREEHLAWYATVEPYQPGRFYLRELPPITAVLATTERLHLLVIDGYVDLDPAGTPGLAPTSTRAYRAAHHRRRQDRLPRRHPCHGDTPGTRGPPAVRHAAGLPAGRAATPVTAMAGAHRIPDALRRVDTAGTARPRPALYGPSPGR
jgi:deoxyribonuclease V